MREYDPDLGAWVERPWDWTVPEPSDQPHEHRWIYAGGRIEEGNEWCQCGEMRKAQQWGDPDREAWQVQRGTDWITAGALICLFLLALATVGAAVWLLIR